MQTIEEKMAFLFDHGDTQAVADLISQAKTPEKQLEAMQAADRAGFGVEFHPRGIRVWTQKAIYSPKALLAKFKAEGII
ncbi:MAG: hypothetical protein EBT03_12960 [Betaproteobacteria bacterium]|nr:hypothetical protein [Betaproteobacteria bacterium]